MASKNAKLAAEKLLETIGTGEKVSMGQILRDVGYADNTADNPKLVTSTASFQETIDPFVEKIKKERDRIVAAMSVKDLDVVQYQHLASATDTLTKNIQLLSGKETARSGVNINVVNYDNSDNSLQV